MDVWTKAHHDNFLYAAEGKQAIFVKILEMVHFYNTDKGKVISYYVLEKEKIRKTSCPQLLLKINDPHQKFPYQENSQLPLCVMEHWSTPISVRSVYFPDADFPDF